MAGYEIVPVPVYYPELTELMGQPVYRRVADVPGDIDIVNVFRRPSTFRRTLMTSSRKNRRPCGSSQGFETMRRPSDSREREYKSFRIAASWLKSVVSDDRLVALLWHL